MRQRKSRAADLRGSGQDLEEKLTNAGKDGLRTRFSRIKNRSSGFRVGNRANTISVRGDAGLGDCTAEALRSQRSSY